MGVQLNIKDEATIDKVRRMALADGRAVTATIRALVDQEWQKREDDRASRLAKIIAATDRIRAAMTDEAKAMTSKEIMDAIYDDDEEDGFAR